MQRLEVSGAVRPIYGSLGVKTVNLCQCSYCLTKISRWDSGMHHCRHVVSPVYVFLSQCNSPSIPFPSTEPIKRRGGFRWLIDNSGLLWRAKWCGHMLTGNAGSTQTVNLLPQRYSISDSFFSASSREVVMTSTDRGHRPGLRVWEILYRYTETSLSTRSPFVSLLSRRAQYGR